MSPTILDRDQVVAKYKELRNIEKTARHFRVGKHTLRLRLAEWNVEVFWVGRRRHVGSDPTRQGPTRFEIGEIVTWIPNGARVGCYGLPIATQPLRVRIQSERMGIGAYKIEVIEAFARRKLPRTNYQITELALFRIEQKETKE